MITFDGANNDVYGVATYVLAQSKAALASDVGTKVPFKVLTKFGAEQESVFYKYEKT